MATEYGADDADEKDHQLGKKLRRERRRVRQALTPPAPPRGGFSGKGGNPAKCFPDRLRRGPAVGRGEHSPPGPRSPPVSPPPAAAPAPANPAGCSGRRAAGGRPTAPAPGCLGTSPCSRRRRLPRAPCGARKGPGDPRRVLGSRPEAGRAMEGPAHLPGPSRCQRSLLPIPEVRGVLEVWGRVGSGPCKRGSRARGVL